MVLVPLRQNLPLLPDLDPGRSQQDNAGRFNLDSTGQWLMREDGAWFLTGGEDCCCDQVVVGPCSVATFQMRNILSIGPNPFTDQTLDGTFWWTLEQTPQDFPDGQGGVVTARVYRYTGNMRVVDNLGVNPTTFGSQSVLLYTAGSSFLFSAGQAEAASTEYWQLPAQAFLFNLYSVLCSSDPADGWSGSCFSTLFSAGVDKSTPNLSGFGATTAGLLSHTPRNTAGGQPPVVDPGVYPTPPPEGCTF